jgi:hypothetical protein
VPFSRNGVKTALSRSRKYFFMKMLNQKNGLAVKNCDKITKVALEIQEISQKP